MRKNEDFYLLRDVRNDLEEILDQLDHRLNHLIETVPDLRQQTKRPAFLPLRERRKDPANE